MKTSQVIRPGTVLKCLRKPSGQGSRRIVLGERYEVVDIVFIASPAGRIWPFISLINSDRITVTGKSLLMFESDQWNISRWTKKPSTQSTLLPTKVSKEDIQIIL